MSRKKRKQIRRAKTKGKPKKSRLPLSKSEMWRVARAMTRLPTKYADKANQVFVEKGVWGCYNVTGSAKIYCSECTFNKCLKRKDYEREMLGM